jgi:hypothetical protein
MKTCGYLYETFVVAPLANLPPKPNKMNPTAAAPGHSAGGVYGLMADVTSFQDTSGDVKSTNS